MANEIYYKRIDIKGDESKLPKEDGIYFVCLNTDDPKINGENTLIFRKHRDIETWLTCVDFYLQPCTDKRDELIEKALKGLNEAKQLIRDRHGMGMTEQAERNTWIIYEGHSPEMKRMNELIAELSEPDHVTMHDLDNADKANDERKTK